MRGVNWTCVSTLGSRFVEFTKRFFNTEQRNELGRRTLIKKCSPDEYVITPYSRESLLLNCSEVSVKLVPVVPRIALWTSEVLSDVSYGVTYALATPSSADA
eukprot:2402393-Rhodomonas_salina.7